MYDQIERKSWPCRDSCKVYREREREKLMSFNEREREREWEKLQSLYVALDVRIVQRNPCDAIQMKQPKLILYYFHHVHLSFINILLLSQDYCK